MVAEPSPEQVGWQDGWSVDQALAHIDEMVGLRVMRWERRPSGIWQDGDRAWTVWRPSKDQRDSIALLEHMRRNGWNVTIYANSGDSRWVVRVIKAGTIQGIAASRDLRVATCLAALNATGQGPCHEAVVALREQDLLGSLMDWEPPCPFRCS